jgi:hypothetical protein
VSIAKAAPTLAVILWQWPAKRTLRIERCCR